MTSNREAAEALLGAASVAMGAVAEQDPEVAATVGAVGGIGFALLDVADAIREQTAALDLGGIRDDLADVAHAARHERE